MDALEPVIRGGYDLGALGSTERARGAELDCDWRDDDLW